MSKHEFRREQFADTKAGRERRIARKARQTMREFTFSVNQ